VFYVDPASGLPNTINVCVKLKLTGLAKCFATGLQHFWGMNNEISLTFCRTWHNWWISCAVGKSLLGANISPV